MYEIDVLWAIDFYEVVRNLKKWKDAMAQPVNIFEYNNYRTFLRDYYLATKARNKNFSFRVFARIAGIKSYSFLNLIMKGKSNISQETAVTLAKAMKLSEEASQFFIHLVFFNQAKTSEEKNFHAQKLMLSRTRRKLYPLSESQYDYFAKWYYPVIRGMVGLKIFKEDPKWIAKRVHPAISPSEASQALADLVKLGLIKRNESGVFVQTDANITTPDEVSAVSISVYHREMMKRASESIDSVPRDKRDLSTITLGISEKKAAAIKERIQLFRKEIVELAGQDPDSDVIYQLSFYLFPLSDPQSGGEK